MHLNNIYCLNCKSETDKHKNIQKKKKKKEKKMYVQKSTVAYQQPKICIFGGKLQ